MRLLRLLLVVVVVSFSAGAPLRASAGPTLLFNPEDGRIFYAERMDDQWHPASLTKIMTAYLTFEALKAGRITLETKLLMSEEARAQPPSKIGLPVGGEMTVGLALRSLIIKSANDVAVMIAESLGGSVEGFAKQMNAKAKKLGMTRTKFVNPNGLPAAEQVTTARDMGRLAAAVLKDFPDYAHFWAMKKMRIGRIRLRSHNRLLRNFDGADGIKTGFICDSGFNIVASATRGEKRLIAVVMGQPTGRERTLRAAALLDHGFQTYSWKSIFTTAKLATTPVPADALPAKSYRKRVRSRSCGWGRKRRVRRVKRSRKGKRRKAAVRARSKKAKAKRGPKTKPKRAAKPKAASPVKTIKRRAPKKTSKSRNENTGTPANRKSAEN